RGPCASGEAPNWTVRSAMASASANDESPGRVGWRALAAVLVVYAAALSAATWPRVLSLGSTLPTLADPVTELCIMRWHRACLLDGRSAAFRPDVQAPVGAPMGQLPPMHLQTLLYIPLSAALANDVLCYNILWVSAFLLTGLGTF